MYVIVKNDYEWVVFLENGWDKFEAFNRITEQYRKDHKYVKRYSKKGRLFLHYQDELFQEDCRDVYESWEISLVTALNWMIAEDKQEFVRQWVISNA